MAHSSTIFQPTQSQIVNHHTAMELSPEIQHKEKLIKLLKKEVKRMMEVNFLPILN